MGGAPCLARYALCFASASLRTSALIVVRRARAHVMITNMVKTEFSMSAVLEMNLYICPAGVPEDLTFKLNQVFPAIFNKWSVFFIVSLSF